MAKAKKKKTKAQKLERKRSMMLLGCTGFLSVLLILHVALDVSYADFLEFKLATCEFDYAITRDNCEDYVYELHGSNEKCRENMDAMTHNLEACVGYTFFYHECCKNKTKFKSLDELKAMKVK